MAATVAQVQAMPGMAAVPDATVEIFLADAAAQLSAAAWGAVYDQAHRLLTGHLIALANRAASGAAGPVQSQSVGSVAQSFGAAPGGVLDVDATLKSTVYGQQFVQLRRGTASMRGPIVARPGVDT